MPVDAQERSSLAYRKYRDAIWRGDVPEKYARLLPFIDGPNVLEIGAAEGVLALALAQKVHSVSALELRADRHAEACALRLQWLRLGRKVDNCTMRCGDIRERLARLVGVDTLVAVRCIYYLRDDVDTVFAAAARHVRTIVLCGNRNRAARWLEGRIAPDDRLGDFNRYASIPAMTGLLERHGYRIEHVVKDGDPIVTGRRHQGPAA